MLLQDREELVLLPEVVVVDSRDLLQDRCHSVDQPGLERASFVPIPTELARDGSRSR